MLIRSNALPMRKIHLSSTRLVSRDRTRNSSQRIPTVWSSRRPTGIIRRSCWSGALPAGRALRIARQLDKRASAWSSPRPRSRTRSWTWHRRIDHSPPGRRLPRLRVLMLSFLQPSGSASRRTPALHIQIHPPRPTPLLHLSPTSPCRMALSAIRDRTVWHRKMSSRRQALSLV